MPTDSSDVKISESQLVNSALEEKSTRISELGLFMRKFLSKGRTISAALPSSRFLAEGLLKHVDFSRPSTIVELGAGTGAVTELIVDRLRPHTRFVAVENDPDFCQVLRRRCPQANILQCDVGAMGEPLSRLGVRKVDYVVSGLPTPNLPRRTFIQMHRWLKRTLTPRGVFAQITVAPLIYREFYQRFFQDVDYEMVWLNLPPGGVYRCRQPR